MFVEPGMSSFTYENLEYVIALLVLFLGASDLLSGKSDKNKEGDS